MSNCQHPGCENGQVAQFTREAGEFFDPCPDCSGERQTDPANQSVTPPVAKTGLNQDLQSPPPGEDEVVVVLEASMDVDDNLVRIQAVPEWGGEEHKQLWDWYRSHGGVNEAYRITITPATTKEGTPQ